MKVKMRHLDSLYEIEITSQLGQAVAKIAEGHDFCELCDSHARSGHTKNCPLIIDALRGGNLLSACEKSETT